MELKEALTLQEEGIKLTRGQKGGVGWEIKINGLDVKKLKDIDNQLKENFQGTSNGDD
jgi:hypothetical protein